MTEYLTKDDSRMLKGFAIIIIMIGHLAGHWTRLFTPFGGMGVALFLICSGYGLEKSFQKSGLDHFWTKRIWTIFLPYAMFEIIRLYIVERAGYIGILQFVKDVTLVKPLFGFGWYLNYLLVWYVIFYSIRKSLKNQGGGTALSRFVP